jgi:hypothetical protein
MSRQTPSSANPITQRKATPADPPPVDFATVSKRIASRTTDLIAIGVVLVGGLSMGRQIHEWWQAEPSVVALAGTADAISPWGTGEAPVDLQFGDYPLAIRRQIVTGDREAAISALIEACRKSLEMDRQSILPASAAADRLLAHAAALSPVAESAGDWQIYRLEDRFSLVLGVRLSADGAQNESRGGTKHLACWGLSAPLNETTWTLYLFHPSATDSTNESGLPEVPIPPEGRRILAIRGTDGGGLIGFSGTGIPKEWRRFSTSE